MEIDFAFAFFHEYWGVCNQQLLINKGDAGIRLLQESITLKKNAWDLLQVKLSVVIA